VALAACWRSSDHRCMSLLIYISILKPETTLSWLL
jgi:hypothetical protein